MTYNAQKRIAVINDFCGFGRCSIAVTLPIISAAGIQCCPLPTSIFSNHTGYDSFFYTDFTEHMEAYMDEWRKLELRFDGILTGFLGSKAQIELVKRFMRLFKHERTVVVVDPVMGDDGSLYRTYSAELAEGMRELLPYADILTPNLTEACILTDTKYSAAPDDGELERICKRLSRMGPKRVVISGIERGEDMDNFVFEAGKAPRLISERRVGDCRAGTGDVFASVIAADVVNCADISSAVRHAASFITKALRRTVERNVPKPDGICFEEFLKEL